MVNPGQDMSFAPSLQQRSANDVGLSQCRPIVRSGFPMEGACDDRYC